MPLNASTTLPASVDRVTAVFTDEAFVRHTSSVIGGTVESFELSGSLDSEFRTTTVRTLPTDRLPDIARKFVGASLKVTQVETWAAPAPDGSREAQVKLSIAGAPLDVTAVQRIVPEGDSARVELEGTVSSSIPFLGGKIAEVAEPMIGKALNLQATQARTWLETH